MAGLLGVFKKIPLNDAGKVVSKKPYIIKNPTRLDASALAQDSGQIRGLIDPSTGDMYVMDAYEGMHKSIADALGLDYDMIRGGTINNNPTHFIHTPNVIKNVSDDFGYADDVALRRDPIEFRAALNKAEAIKDRIDAQVKSGKPIPDDLYNRYKEISRSLRAAVTPTAAAGLLGAAALTNSNESEAGLSKVAIAALRKEANANRGLIDAIEYQGQHAAPRSDSGAPLFDITRDGIYPSDVYSSQGLNYYGTGSPLDAETFRLLTKAKGNPDADIKIYRAVPSDVESDAINKGDWVSTSKQYAIDHGDSALQGDYKILEDTVKAKDLYTSGDSWLEWGYDPKAAAALAGSGLLASEVLTPKGALAAGQLGTPEESVQYQNATNPNLVKAADLLDKIELPIIGPIAPNFAEYLRKMGYNDKQSLLDYVSAAGDIY